MIALEDVCVISNWIALPWRNGATPESCIVRKRPLARLWFV